MREGGFFGDRRFSLPSRAGGYLHTYIHTYVRCDFAYTSRASTNPNTNILKPATRMRTPNPTTHVHSIKPPSSSPPNGRPETPHQHQIDAHGTLTSPRHTTPPHALTCPHLNPCSHRTSSTCTYGRNNPHHRLLVLTQQKTWQAVTNCGWDKSPWARATSPFFFPSSSPSGLIRVAVANELTQGVNFWPSAVAVVGMAWCFVRAGCKAYMCADVGLARTGGRGDVCVYVCTVFTGRRYVSRMGPRRDAMCRSL